MDFKRTESGTYEVLGLLGIIGLAILMAAAMGVYDPTRLETYYTLKDAVGDSMEARGFVPDVAPTMTVDVAIGYDRVTRQYSFAGSVSPQGMADVQEQVTLRGYEPTAALAPRVERLAGIDPFGASQRDEIDLRFVRETTETVEYVAIDSDGQRYYVVRVEKPRD